MCNNTVYTIILYVHVPRHILARAGTRRAVISAAGKYVPGREETPANAKVENSQLISNLFRYMYVFTRYAVVYGT